LGELPKKRRIKKRLSDFERTPQKTSMRKGFRILGELPKKPLMKKRFLDFRVLVNSPKNFG